MSTGFHLYLGHLHRVSVDRRARASIPRSLIFKTYHFQIIDLSFFISEPISEVIVLLVLLHQLLYGLKNCEMLNTPDEVGYTNTHSDGRANS